jgi:uncharacterized membrane protein
MVNPFDLETKRRIIETIIEAERKTSGEIRIHVKPKCWGDPIKEGRRIFRHLCMHRTKERNGVLIFVAWKNRQFAIIGDEGIHRKVGDSFWSQTRDVMKGHFSAGNIAEGMVAGVRSIGERLKEYFPAQTGDKNELSNTVSEGT